METEENREQLSPKVIDSRSDEKAVGTLECTCEDKVKLNPFRHLCLQVYI